MHESLSAYSSTAWRLVACYVLAYVALLYWHYPFDGMVVNESWNFHDNEVQQFRFPGYGDSTKTGAPKTFFYNPDTGRYDFSFVHSRRGLVPIIYLLFEKLSIGNHVVFMNAVCVAVIAVNLLLFAYVVWRLAGPELLLPSVLVYSLYPFAAASHFLQVIVVNNLAVTFLLLSFALYLKALSVRDAGAGRMLVWGIPGLVWYWLSIFNHEYALFLSPLCLYVALYQHHGHTTLWRFSRWRTPAVFLGGGYLLISVVASGFLVSDVPSLLLYAPRFRELATALHAPEWLVPILTGAVNALLFYASAVFSNSIGYLLYPALLLWSNLAALPTMWLTLLAGGLLGALVVWGLMAAVRKSPSQVPSIPDRQTNGFLPIFGGAWAVLAYLPFSTSIGYPRIVGMMADRVNILAACGIALMFGWLLRRLFLAMCAGAMPRRAAIIVAVWLATVVLTLNLYIQRAYYEDAYRKEREVAQLVLAAGEEARRAGREVVVLLDRSTKSTFPRAQLMAALGEPGLMGKARRLVEFLLDRYFRQEVVSTSFHLHGLYLFGCCPDSGHQTFDGYAKLWSRKRVPVYKLEEPFRLYEDDTIWKIGYRDIRVWSDSFGADKLTTYSKRDYQLMVLDLDDSMFRFGGPVAYRLRSYPEALVKFDRDGRMM